MSLKELTNADIKALLEDAPLYVWREFKMPALNRADLSIRQIDADCKHCKQVRPFQIRTGGSSGGGSGGPAMRLTSGPVGRLTSGIQTLDFACVTCQLTTYRFHIERIVSEDTIKIQKYGELPKRKFLRDPVVQRFFEDDRENYEKAVSCLAHEYGIAAFAYFRRIIEGHISKLLDLVQEDAKSSSADPKILEALAELRSDAPMSSKIKLANKALPAHLKPDGLNPLGKLYQVLSEGVHNLPDQECLDKAKAMSECLAFLVSELASRKEHQARFKKLVAEL